MGTIFHEDKEKITKALLPVLQMTNNGQDIKDIEYIKTEHCENVIVTYNNDYTKIAVVTVDSGTALIGDVMRQIFGYH